MPCERRQIFSAWRNANHSLGTTIFFWRHQDATKGSALLLLLKAISGHFRFKLSQADLV